MNVKYVFPAMIFSMLFGSFAEAKPNQNNNPNNYRPRAEGATLGLGVGVSVPSDSLDTYALRIRMNPNLIIEPMLHYTQYSGTETSITTMDEIDPASGDPTGETTTSSLTTTTDFSSLGAGLGMRYRIGRRGNTDLQAIGGVGYVNASSSSKVNGVDGSDQLETTSIAVNAGIGVENFFAPKWSAGFDLTTPVYQTNSTSSTPADVLESATTTGETSGVALSPSLRIMLVHYF